MKLAILPAALAYSPIRRGYGLADLETPRYARSRSGRGPITEEDENVDITTEDFKALRAFLNKRKNNNARAEKNKKLKKNNHDLLTAKNGR